MCKGRNGRLAWVFVDAVRFGILILVSQKGDISMR